MGPHKWSVAVAQGVGGPHAASLQAHVSIPLFSNVTLGSAGRYTFIVTEKCSAGH